MPRPPARVAGYAVAGAVVGAIAAAFAFALHPAMTLDLERDLPTATRGFYPVEHATGEAFAWTGARADLSLPGFDRDSAGRPRRGCTVYGARA